MTGDAADGAADLKGGVNVTKRVPLDCHVICLLDMSFVYFIITFLGLCLFLAVATPTINALVLFGLQNFSGL